MVSDFAICLTCPEIVAGRVDSSKGWLLDESSNHFGCDVRPFTDLANLPAPIRNTVLRLGAGIGVRGVDIAMLKLGLDLEDQWTPHPYRSPSTAPVAASTSTTSPAPVTASAASTRSLPASPPTSTTSVEPDLFDLLGDAS